MMLARYPEEPGIKRGAASTSAEAADSAISWAANLRQQALELLRTGLELTADEIASRLGCHPLAMRPRISELRATGTVYDTGKRRENAISGRRAAVWAAVVAVAKPQRAASRRKARPTPGQGELPL